MGMKTFDDVGNVGFSKSWRDEVQDLILEFKAGDVRALRFLNSFLPIVTHWMPFISKNGGRIRFFPQMCLRWNLEASVIDEDAECPGCDREIFAAEGGVFWVLDVDALYVGDKNRALKLIELGSRERKKLGNLSKFNKVQGTPQHVAHSKYGRIVQVSFDPNNSDKSMRWQFSNHDRLPVKVLNEGTQLKVKIPESADSDYVGKVFSFELQDLLELVFPPSLADSKDKCRRMKVDEALKRLKADDRQKEEDEDSGGSRRRRSSGGTSPRRRQQEDEDEPRSRRRRRHDEEDDDEPRSRRRRRHDEEDDDEPRSRRRGRDDDDDDPQDDFEAEDEPRSRRSSRRKRRDADEDEPRSRHRRRHDEEDEDDPQDDFGDDDDFEDEGAKTQDDDDDDVEEPEKPRGRRQKKKTTKGRRKRSEKRNADEDDDDEKEDKAPCNKKASRGQKCALHKHCFGHIGDENTEDCTLCVHKDDCMDLNADDED